MRSSASLVVTLLCAAIALSTVVSARRPYVNDVGYNVHRPPLDAPAFPYKGRIMDTETIAPPGIREARLVCDRQMQIHRIVTCEMHTFDLCGNAEGDIGNITQWVVRVESETGRDTNSLVAPITWLSQGIARFYFTPVRTGFHVVSVFRAPSLTHLDPLVTPPLMKTMVTVHESIVTCTDFLLNTPPRPTLEALWAQSSRDNERAPIYGIEPQTSDRTHVFADIARAYGAGIGTGLSSRTGRDPISPFQVGALGDVPREDNSAFRFCDYVQRSQGN